MNIQEVLRTMNQMVADGIIQRYAVGGAVGATFYLEPVSTLDVDIFVELHAALGSKLLSLDPIFSYLRKRGGKMEGEHIAISGWPVQFIPPTGPLTEEALNNAKEIDVAGFPARVFTPEYLAAIALQTGRAKDKARVLQFVEADVLDSTKFEQLIERHELTDKWRTFRQQFLSND
jgi:hypothetical protein